MLPKECNKIDNTALTEEEIKFLEAIQDDSKRKEVISILMLSGSIPA